MSLLSARSISLDSTFNVANYAWLLLLNKENAEKIKSFASLINDHHPLKGKKDSLTRWIFWKAYQIIDFYIF